ncbi:MAG TPA: hypothetical protein VGK19_20965 [Capsulimonadaceae bacterium]|jgi:hypothetical protein
MHTDVAIEVKNSGITVVWYRPRNYLSLGGVDNNMDIPSLVLTATLSAASAALASAFSLRVGQANYFRQKSWEKRAETYSKAMESLAKAKHFFHEYLLYLKRIKSVPDEYRKEYFIQTVEPLRKACDDAAIELGNLSFSASIFISPRAVAHLQVLNDEIERSTDAYSGLESFDLADYFQERYEAISRCQTALLHCAKEELKI